MTPAHIACTGAFIAAGVVALAAIVVSVRESWGEFLDALGEQDQ